MNTEVDTSMSCDILMNGCFCLHFSHIRSNLYFTDCTEQKYNSEFVLFFSSSISGTSNCSSAQLLSVYSIKEEKSTGEFMDTFTFPVRYLLAKQLFNITLSGIRRVFIYAAHLDVELQPIQNVMYHSFMEIPKIAI